MRDSESAISITNLTKYYTKLEALKDINLTIKRGEFFAFLGPNGAGKTTMINVIAGLSYYKTGTVKIFGYDAKHEYIQTRKLVGLCSQEFNFDPFFTLHELLVYQAGYFGIPTKIACKRADELLERFQLIDK